MTKNDLSLFVMAFFYRNPNLFFISLVKILKKQAQNEMKQFVFTFFFRNLELILVFFSWSKEWNGMKCILYIEIIYLNPYPHFQWKKQRIRLWIHTLTNSRTKKCGIQKQIQQQIRKMHRWIQRRIRKQIRGRIQRHNMKTNTIINTTTNLKTNMMMNTTKNTKRM